MNSSISSFRAWFLRCVALTFALCTAGFGATEMLIRSKVEPQDLLEQNIEVFYKAKTPNALFGDSIAAAGFIPDGTEFVNLASGGETPAGTLVKVKGFYQDRATGRAIIAANHNMLRRRPGTPLDFEAVFFKQRRAPLRIMESRHRGYSFRYWHTYFLKDFDSNRMTLPHGGEVFTNPADNLRFGRMSLDKRREAGAAKAFGEMPSPSDRRDANEQNYREILEFLKARRVETCLVSFPMSPSLRLVADTHPIFALTRQWYRDTAEQFGFKHIDYWDAFDEDAIFMDPTHLSEAGGRKLAPMILRDCFGITTDIVHGAQIVGNGP